MRMTFRKIPLLNLRGSCVPFWRLTKFTAQNSYSIKYFGKQESSDKRRTIMQPINLLSEIDSEEDTLYKAGRTNHITDLFFWCTAIVASFVATILAALGSDTVAVNFQCKLTQFFHEN